ncbi:hypothetical protein QQ045_024786 [Rhodiola kirilowii]
MTLSSCFPWLLCIAVFLAFCSFHSVHGQCVESQRSLLLQLKHDFNTTIWGNKIKSWNTTTDCCKWAGVTCTSGYVTGLDLSGEGIDNGDVSGTSALFKLRNLTTLNLAQNLLDTTIPPAFSKLENLIHLNLGASGFNGQIPIEISKLTRLVTLDISSFFFFGCKVDNPNLRMLVGNMSNLVELHLREVDLSSQSDWSQVLSSSLHHLQVLDLASSGISDPIDPSLQNLKSLSIVDLSGNMFRGPFPNLFSNLRNLTSLNLAESGVSGKVSEKIFQLPKLRFLDVSENYQLQGGFPRKIKDSSLETLVLKSTTFWKTIPDSIGQLKMLTRLDISQSHLVGPIPKSLSQLTNLVFVYMPSNTLTGSVPSLSQAKNLRELDLSYNELTGSLLSTDWKQLTRLESILIRGNSLSGSIPASLFGIPSLKKASLTDNHFTGFTKESLHLTSLGQLKDLSSLYLSRSNLVIEMGTGIVSFPHLDSLGLASCGLKEIPSFLKNHPVIENVDLSENQIRGQIPSWIWEIDTLTSLNLSHNHLESIQKTNYSSGVRFVDLSANLLHGELPHLPYAGSFRLSQNHFNSTLSSIIRSIGTGMTFLDISINNLHGSIPESLCTNTNFYYLDLSENFLSGSIPGCLPNIENIHTLNLRKNNLSGISDTLTAKCSLEKIDFSGNILQGSIPKSLGNCTGLKMLDLSNNKLEKMIPYELGYFGSLQALNASYNKLTGPIPTSFGNLTALESLDLAKNQLSGKIPKQLGSLKLLTFLNVSYNHLVGMIPKSKQFRNFTEASFEGNEGLCGAPLKKQC